MSRKDIFAGFLINFKQFLDRLVIILDFGVINEPSSIPQ